ncbi:MAG: dihydrofolate reductase family protein [Acidimicrobiia bacterium]
MRRIVTFNNVSADGYFAAKDGNLDWVVQDPELDQFVMKEGRAVDTVLFGRVTYEQFESFWPGVAKDPNAPPELLLFAKPLEAMTKVVFSKTRDTVTWKNSRLVRDIVPRDIERMKREEGGDIIVFGSGSVVTALSEYGLVDEYVYTVNPVLLGEGRLLLKGLGAGADLELLQAKPFESGKILMRYARKGPLSRREHVPAERISQRDHGSVKSEHEKQRA